MIAQLSDHVKLLSLTAAVIVVISLEVTGTLTSATEQLGQHRERRCWLSHVSVEVPVTFASLSMIRPRTIGETRFVTRQSSDLYSSR
jgi:hypothetical protein